MGVISRNGVNLGFWFVDWASTALEENQIIVKAEESYNGEYIN